MYKYRNEAHFSNALCKAMRESGWFVQRIESGTTGKGIPDIYAIDAHNNALWLELKRVHHNRGAEEVIPWRPGQQAWLYDVTRRKQHAYTLVAFDDCIVQIEHLKVHSNDIVDCTPCGFKATPCSYSSVKDFVRRN